MINKAEQDLQDSLIDRLANVERQLRELKAATQPVGASTLTMELLPADGPFVMDYGTVAAGSTVILGMQFANSDEVFTLWDWLFDIYIDGHDAAHRYTDPANTLTSNQQKFDMRWWIAATDSLSAGDNSRTLKFQIKNEDASSHTYYVDVRAVAPKMLGETTAT